MGVGVTLNITTEQGLRQAFDYAQTSSRDVVLIEQMLDGDYYRLTCVNFQVVAADRRVRATLRGDGRTTIKQFLDRVYIQDMLDDNAFNDFLSRLGLDRNSVLAVGQVVNLSGAPEQNYIFKQVPQMVEPVLPRVHPDNIELAERALRLFGLDLGGVDFITPDISRSWREGIGAINEVNAHPGLAHTFSCGNRDIYKRLLEGLIPVAENGRIPTAALAGSGSQPILSGIRWLLSERGHQLAPISGADRSTALPAEDNPKSVILDTAITAAPWQTNPQEIERLGIAFDRIDVAVVADPFWTAGKDSQTPVSQAHVDFLMRLASKLIVREQDLDRWQFKGKPHADTIIVVLQDQTKAGNRQRILEKGYICVGANIKPDETIVTISTGDSECKIAHLPRPTRVGDLALTEQMATLAAAVVHFMSADPRCF